MIEISCSTDDLASTPSNRSEYFSVNSSLNILDSNEEIYHSFDEEIEPHITCDSIHYYNRRIQQCKIMKQHHLEIDIEENVCLLSTSNETIPESNTCRNSAECELWDKCIQSLQMAKSQESINTFEEEIINSSIYSNSQLKDSSIIENDNINNSSETEESISTNLLSTSQIEGELSDINDIIYDSSISPVNATNPMISEENDSSQVDVNISDEVPESKDNITLLVPVEMEIEMSIFEMVKQLEHNEKLECEPMTISVANEKETSIYAEKDNEKPITVECHVKIHEEPPNQMTSTIEMGNNKEIIINVEDSPVKRSYLCCAIRKNKKRVESPKSKHVQKSKAKQFFSFFKKPSTVEKKPIVEKEIIVEQNNYKCLNSTFVNSIDYDGIPFIDADVTIDTEDYISLAKQEIFSE